MRPALLTSLSLTLYSIILGAAAVQALRPSHPPYLSARHRSLIIARADAPPACAAKQVPVNGTATNATDTNTPSGGTVANATDTSIPLNGTATDASGANATSVVEATPLPSPIGSTNTSTSTVVNSTESDAATPTATDIASAPPSGVDDPAPIDNSTSAADDTTLDGNSTAGLRKRIAQFDLPDVASAWQELCLISGGDAFTQTGEDSPCVKLAGFDGINALLANADPCAQQDNADAMIDFAKTPGVINSDVLTKFAILYRKHPRNALNVLGVVPSTPYCQRAPRNPELNGVFNEQLDGVDPGVFGGPDSPLVPFGSPGTCPFGMTPDIDSCSCLSVNATDASASGFNTTDTSSSGFNTTDTTGNSNVTTTLLPPSTANATDTAIATDPAAATSTLTPLTNATESSSAVAVTAIATVNNTAGIPTPVSNPLGVSGVPTVTPTLLFNTTLPQSTIS